MSAIVNNILKPLRFYFKDNIKEVVMNKPMEIIVEDHQGEWTYFKDKNLTHAWFKSMATIMASTTGQTFNSSSSELSFKLPEGHRVQIAHGSCTKHKLLLTIRIFRGIIYQLDDYEISQIDKIEIIKAVQNKENLLISGGTSTGKTSFLNCLINNYVNKEERIVTIEGVPELVIKSHRNVASLFYQESEVKNNNKVSDLLNASLRMRPDRIILGELRKENSFVFIRAINTGHDGSMSTIHANSSENALSAIKENVILNGDANQGAMDILEMQLRRNIHGVIQLTKVKGGKVKGCFKRIKTH